MRSISGNSQILDLLPEVLFDESRFGGGIPDTVFFPESIEDLRSIICTAHSTAHKIVFAGAQTGLTAGAAPVDNCYLIVFSAMNKINRVTIIDGSPVIFCEPGVTLSTINEFLLSPGSFRYYVPGCETIQNQKFFFPPDPTEPSAHIGGAVATNASGARSYRFGSIRNHIVHITGILSSEDIIQVPRSKYISNGGGFTVYTDNNNRIHIPHPAYTNPSTKNASGYFNKNPLDLIDILIGSEGTLAAFAEIGIKLSPRVEFLSGMSFFGSPGNAFDFADILRTESQIASIEYFDESALQLLMKCKNDQSVNIPDFPSGKLNAVFWEFMENSPEPFESRMNEFERALEQCNGSFESTWSGFDIEHLVKLKSIRHLVPEMINSTIAQIKTRYPGIRKIATDTAVPPPCFREVIQQYLDLLKDNSLHYVLFGHLGDFHLHLNIIPFDETEFTSALDIYEKMMSLTIAYSGTISAEHGVGKLKQKYFHQMYSKVDIEEMVKIKKTFDPDGIFNPGNLF